MQSDAALAGKSGDARHLAKIEYLAVAAPHRRFDRDRTHWRAHPAVLFARNLGDDFVERETGPPNTERDQGEPAQLLRAIAAITVEVAFALD
jgi:hypothetical protein